jgi:hypothetical protein
MNPTYEPAPTVHRTVGIGQPPARATLKYERLPLLAVSMLALLVALSGRRIVTQASPEGFT